MPYASGTFTLYATGNPVVTGTTISSSWANNTLNDIATGLSTCVLKDGTQTITANLPMAGFKLTGLAAGSTAGDSLRYEQLVGVYLPLAGGTMTGNLLFTDATYDIGASGATRPRDLFLSRNAVIGGTLNVTGHPTLEGVTATGATGTGKMVFDTSPTLTTAVLGSSTATTQTVADNSTKVATTAYVESYRITLGTEQASTSGTVIDFTGIPAGVRRINVMLDSVSINDGGHLLIQLGDAGGFENTGYDSVVGQSDAGGAGTTQRSNAGFIIINGDATRSVNGCFSLLLMDSANFTWVGSGNMADYASTCAWHSGGKKALSAELTQVRITSSTGGTFDAGAINISYEY